MIFKLFFASPEVWKIETIWMSYVLGMWCIAWRLCSSEMYLMSSSWFSFFLGLTQIPQVQKTEISFTASDPKSFEPYVKNLENFLKDYSAEEQTQSMIFQDCGGKSWLFPIAECSDQCLCNQTMRSWGWAVLVSVSSSSFYCNQWHVGKLWVSGFSHMTVIKLVWTDQTWPGM